MRGRSEGAAGAARTTGGAGGAGGADRSNIRGRLIAAGAACVTILVAGFGPAAAHADSGHAGHAGHAVPDMLASTGTPDAGPDVPQRIFAGGDFNDDGVPDLVHAWPTGPTRPTRSSSSTRDRVPGPGSVELIDGATGELIVALAGSTAGSEFGTAIWARSDLDGDGLCDVAVGAPRDGAGAVHIFFGPTLRAAARTQRIPDPGLIVVGDPTTGDHFGSRIGVVRDLDNDGHLELAIEYRGLGRADADMMTDVRSLPFGRTVARIAGAVPYDVWATSAADLDGDGRLTPDDQTTMLRAWGHAGASFDLDGNDHIDDRDVAILHGLIAGGGGDPFRPGDADFDLGCNCLNNCICEEGQYCIGLPSGQGICAGDNVIICPQGAGDCDFCPTCPGALCLLTVYGPVAAPVDVPADTPWNGMTLRFEIVPKWADVHDWSVPTGSSHIVVLETTDTSLTVGVIDTGLITIRAQANGCGTDELDYIITSADDWDGDGFDNDCETDMGTSPWSYDDAPDPNADNDGDSLADVDEICLYGTSPTTFDTDHDGLPDAWELLAGTDTNVPDDQDDPDGDGAVTLIEYMTGSDPFDSDSDDDGVIDGDESFDTAFPNCTVMTGGATLIDAIIVNPGTTLERVIGLGGSTTPSVCRGETLQFHSTEGQGAHLYTGAIESGHEYVVNTNAGADPFACLSSIFQTTAGIGDGSFRFRWISHPGDGSVPCVDFVDVDVRDPQYIIAPDSEDPGACLLLVNREDADGDGIPDYADGFNLREEDPNDDVSIDDTFTAMSIAVPDMSALDSPAIAFSYDLADPASVNMYIGADGPVYAAPLGTLRIWRTPAHMPRDPDVDLIRPDEPLAPEDLGVPVTGGPLTVWVETVRTSTDIGDQSISVAMDGCVDTIGFTGITMRYARVAGDGSLTTIDQPDISIPAPTFDMSTFNVTGIRADGAGAELIGDINVSGVLDDALSDLIPGEEGIISTIEVFVDGLPLMVENSEAPYVIDIPAANISKGGGPSTIDKPFDYSAFFTHTIVGAKLNAGFNIIRLEASNARGFVGHAELVIGVTAEAPPDEHFEIDVAFMADRVGISGAAVSASRTLLDDPEQTTQYVSGWLSNELFVESFFNTLGISIVGLTGIDGEAFDPLVNQAFLARVALDPFNLTSRLMRFERTDPLEAVFRAVYERTAQHRTTWDDHEFAVNHNDVTESDAGVHEPFVMELYGPMGIGDIIDTIEFADAGGSGEVMRTFDLVPHDGRLTLSRPDSDAPEIMVALPAAEPAGFIETLETGDVLDIFNAFVAFNDEYFRGFGQGLWDTGVDIVDSVGFVLKAAHHLVSNYTPHQMAIRYLRSGDVLLEEDRTRVDFAAEAIDVLAERVQALLIDNLDVYINILIESDSVLTQFGTAMPFIMNAIIEVIDEIRDLLYEVAPEQFGHATGWISGRVVGEATAEVLTAVSTAGIGSVAIRTARVLGTINRVRARCSVLASSVPTIPGFSPALMQSIVDRLDALFTKLVAIVGRRQCFPAGTVVLTEKGLVPIEQISTGDLVMTRSPRTNAQSYRPVKRVLHSRASQMVRVRYTVCDEDSSDAHAGPQVVRELVTTGDHPFHVPAYGSFVEAQRLVAGMELTTSNGHHPVIVTDVEPIHTDGRPVMVYNLEVEGDHTYFVGDAGIWVHNTCSAPFENAFAVITKIRQNNPDHWSSFVEALEATAGPARAARFDAGMPEICDALMTGMYRDALAIGESVDLSKVRTVAQLKAFRLTPAGNRLNGHDIDIHHIVPKEYATLLYRIKYGKDPSREWLDAMPGLLVNKHLHRQSTEGVSSFHQLLNVRVTNAIDALPNPASAEDMRSSVLGAIAHTYNEWDPQYGIDFWVVARGWALANDI
jgi:hypothetical protein